MTSQKPPQQLPPPPESEGDKNRWLCELEITRTTDGANVLVIKAKLNRQLATTIAALVLRAKEYARHTPSQRACVRIHHNHKWVLTEVS